MCSNGDYIYRNPYWFKSNLEIYGQSYNTGNFNNTMYAFKIYKP